MTWHIPNLFCESCEREHRPGLACPRCTAKTCAGCGWCSECADRTLTPAPGQVKPGQVWADNDPRSEGRTLRVDEIDGEFAVCTILTDANPELRWAGAKSTVGRATRIRLRRFRLVSTGYRYLRDAEAHGQVTP